MTHIENQLRAFIAKRVLHRYAQKEDHKPGDVWQTSNGNWRAMDPKGVNPKTFKDKEEADQYAKGKWRREVREKDMGGFLKKDVQEVFSKIDEQRKEEGKVKEMYTLPRGIKRVWGEVKDDFSKSLKEGKYRRAILEGAGDVLKAAYTSLKRSGLKELTRATDAFTSKALKGVVVFGENVDQVKDEFKDRVEELKQHYDVEKKKIKDPKEVSKLNQAFQEKYDEEKQKYEDRMNSAVSYSEIKNYRMMGKVVSNAVMGKSEEFDLSDEEKKTGWMYLGYLVGGTVLGGSAAIATGLSNGLKSALLPLLGSTVGSAITGKVGALAVGSLAYKAAHIGIRAIQNKLDKDKQVNEYLDDYIAGYKNVDSMEEELKGLKEKAKEDIQAIKDQDLPGDEEKEKIQKIHDDLEAEEVKIHEAMSKGEKALAKYAHIRVAMRYMYGSGDPEKAAQEIMKMLIEEGLEGSIEELKKDPDKFLEELADGVTQFIEVGKEEG